MSVTPQELEQIVREVLRRLREREITSEVTTEAKASAGRDDAQTLAIAGRLVTLETVNGKLAGVERLTAPAGAIVTPAVRDELKTRRIRLEFIAKGPAQGGSLRRLIVMTTSDYNPAAVLKAAAKMELTCEARSAADWKAGVQNMTQEVTTTNTLGLLLTGQPAAAACLANRDAAVRAAVATDGKSARQAVETLDANLLVVDPAVHSLNALENILREYTRA